MGMYDIFYSDDTDNNQLKIFYRPYCYDDGYIHYSGGDLKYYAIGDPVPWRTPWYNYTKNFTALNVDPLSEEFLIYVFRDGKFAAFYDLGCDLETVNWLDYADKIFEIDEQQLFIDGNGNLLNISNTLGINNIWDIRNYFDASIRYEKVTSDVWYKTKALGQMLFECIKATHDFNLWKEATQELSNVRQELTGNIKEVCESYLIKDRREKLAKYGAYLQCIYKDHFINMKLDETIKKAAEFAAENKIGIGEYFAWNETPEEDKKWIFDTDRKIREVVGGD